MANYTCSQLAQLWVQAGGPSAVANLMASIAMAESSGNPQASNTNTNGTVDRGLWQINSVHGSQNWFDPLTNAQEAVALYKDQGTSPWSSSQPHWGSNPACGTAAGPVQTGPVGAPAGAGGITTLAARGGSSDCVHPFTIFNMSTPLCFDGIVGMGAALLGLVALLVGLLMLTGRTVTAGGMRFPYAVVPRV